MKRAIAFLGILLLIMQLTSVAIAAENLLTNGSFEILTSSGEPRDWYASAYRNQAGYSKIAVTSEKAYSGQYSAVIENASSNDARYTCTVRVKPVKGFRLYAYGAGIAGVIAGCIFNDSAVLT